MSFNCCILAPFEPSHPQKQANKIPEYQNKNQWGTGLRYSQYTSTDLNQYASRTVPGYTEVQGSAVEAATVTVNNQPTYRKDGYFRSELTLTNVGGPVNLPVDVVGVLRSGTNDIVTNITGKVIAPASTETFAYDADGNLTTNGLRRLIWDAENRLIEVQPLPSARWTNSPSLVFGYDHQGRRISKVVSNWSGSGWTVTLNQKFVYDGWNLLATLNGTNSTVIQSYLWGTDLSGTMQGAGGVGGLLAVIDSAKGSHFVSYDGNGNVTLLVNASTGVSSAEYVKPRSQILIYTIMRIACFQSSSPTPPSAMLSTSLDVSSP